MDPNPVTQAAGTIAQSHQFSDLEKVLLLVILGVFVGFALAIWRGGGWVAKVAWPQVTALVRELIEGLAQLKSELVASNTAHTARVDKLGTDVRAEVKTVGLKVDALGGKVDNLSKSVDAMGQDVASRLSGAEDALTQTRLDMANRGIVPDPPPPPPSEPMPQRQHTQPKLRAV